MCTFAGPLADIIVSSDGQKIPCSHVKGDSGAWMIKWNGNMLMGQIHSYTFEQVLFTPIDVIFDDITVAYGMKVFLPPPSLDPEPATEALQLCSMPDTPPTQPLNCLRPRHMPGADTVESPTLKTLPPKTQYLESSITGQNDIVNAQNEMISNTFCDSPPFFPNLTDTLQVSKSDSGLLEAFQPCEDAVLSRTQRDLLR